MKMQGPPLATATPVIRIVMVQHAEGILMVMVPSAVSDADADSLIQFAIETTRHAQYTAPVDFVYATYFAGEMDKMKLGFVVIDEATFLKRKP